MYFWINGGHESREEIKDDQNKREGGRRRRRKRENGGWDRAVREEFETLSTPGRGKEGPMATGLRETESAPVYNLKTHSAFKLLTMAAGYKVLCRCHGIEKTGARGRTRGKGRARFKSLIYLRGDCGRHDDATAGRSGAYSRDGEK